MIIHVAYYEILYFINKLYLDTWEPTITTDVIELFTRESVVHDLFCFYINVDTKPWDIERQMIENMGISVDLDVSDSDIDIACALAISSISDYLYQYLDGMGLCGKLEYHSGYFHPRYPFNSSVYLQFIPYSSLGMNEEFFGELCKGGVAGNYPSDF